MKPSNRAILIKIIGLILTLVGGTYALLEHDYHLLNLIGSIKFDHPYNVAIGIVLLLLGLYMLFKGKVPAVIK